MVFVVRQMRKIFGFTYAELDEYIRTGVMEDTEKKRRIDLLHEKNLFKVKLMPGFEI